MEQRASVAEKRALSFLLSTISMAVATNIGEKSGSTLVIISLDGSKKITIRRGLCECYATTATFLSAFMGDALTRRKRNLPFALMGGFSKINRFIL